MPGALSCLLSYGLTCAPAQVEVVDVPAPTPLEPTPVEPTPVEPTTPGSDAPIPKKGAASLVLAKVQAYYDKTSDLQAKFEQTYTNAIYGTKKVSNGTLKVRKPGLMVWDYADAESPDFWVDQNLVYVVEAAQKQVIKKDVGDSDIAGADKFLFGGHELVEDFQVKLAPTNVAKQYGSAGHTVILLRPKRSNPHYKMLLLVVDDQLGRADAFAILNQDGSTNLFELSGLARNTGLSAAALKFKKPSGYAQIDE